MELWDILLTVVINVPWLLCLIVGVIIYPIVEQRKYKNKYKKWNQDNPDLTRMKCKNCKYCRSETYWWGRYPNGIPKRVPEYCSLLKRRIGENSSCMLAEPPKDMLVSKTKPEKEPIAGMKVYYSAYGNCYHSSDNCPSIRNAHNIYCSNLSRDRRPCPKCWKEINGVLYPK